MMMIATIAISGRASADTPPAEKERDSGAATAAPEIITVRGTAPASTGVRDLTSASERSPDAARALDDPAFVTVVRIDERAAETRSVAEVLARTVGVQVRSLGGLGSFSSLSVRGGASGHTAVLVDGVPVSRVASVSTDLSRFELESFSSLELYRGGVPGALGGAALGGVLNLHTHIGRPPSGRRLTLSTGAGSFGARHLRARWLGGDSSQRGYHLALGYSGADGDFLYFNDNGTNLEPSDDRFERRTNNGYDQLTGVARWRRISGDYAIEAGARSLYKEQGVPGSASVQSLTTSLRTTSQILDVLVRKQRALGLSWLSSRAAGFAVLEAQRYRDLDGEVGLGTQDRSYLSTSFGGNMGMRARPWSGHTLEAGAESRFDYFRDRDRIGDRMQTFGSRLAGALTASSEWRSAAERVVARPALRLDVMRTDPIADADSPVVGPMDLSPRTELFWSPRLSMRTRVIEGVVLKANAGYYFRAPTLLELYGDRGFVVGNPGLRAETGLTADAGLVVAPSHAVSIVDRLIVEAVAFESRPRDTIVLIPTAGLVTVAQNLGDARVRGVELGASGRVARTVTASANYTLLATEQRSPVPSYDGKQLPQRPRHQLYGRIDVARRVRDRMFVVWADAAVTSRNFLDPGNVSETPARQLYGAGIKLEPIPWLLVGLEAKNLTDRRVESIRLDPPPRPDLTSVPRAVSELFGYPLPGRAFYLTLEWKR